MIFGIRIVVILLCALMAAIAVWFVVSSRLTTATGLPKGSDAWWCLASFIFILPIAVWWSNRE